MGGCPVCRTPVANTPMIPNRCMDSTVDTHIQMRCVNGDEDWGPDGKKLAEFRGRQKQVSVVTIHLQ